MLHHKLYNIIVLAALGLFINAAHGQYTIKVEDIDVPKHIASQVAKSQDAAKIVSIPPGDYINAISKSGQRVDKGQTSIYVAANGHYAVESTAMHEKTTMIYNGMFNMIMWGQKKVIRMSKAQIKELATAAQNMMSQMQKNMPDINQMLKNSNLTPEQMEAAKNAMSGLSMGNQPDTKSKPIVQSTNRSATFVNQKAKLHIIKEGNRTKGVWASSTDKALAKTFREMGESMDALTSMAKDKQIREWELLPGMYPLSSVVVSQAMYGPNDVTVTRTVEMKKAITNKKAFYVPGKAEGFMVGGPELMMGGFSGKRKH